MYSQRLIVALATFALLSSAGCRDEQAGPKNRQRPAPPPAMAAAPAPSAAMLDAPPSDLTFVSGATFADGTIQYIGSKLEPAQPSAGQQVRLSHYFRALKTPPTGWSFFVHVVDPQSGAMMANADHEFAGGALPLQSWQVGKIAVDQHTMVAGPSAARVLLGFWRGNDRLPVDQANRQDGQMRVLGPLVGDARAQLPEYRAKKAQKAPAIDGKLDDAAWNDAAPVTLKGSFDGRDVPLKTTARIVYDDTHLYVAFDSEDPDVWGTLMQRDEPIYTQEVVEVFLDANADGATYNELQVSPNNVIFDAYFPARRQGMDTSWDSKMQTAVNVRGTVNDDGDRDEGWSAELKIPYATLSTVPNVPPKPGDRWRFNLYRLELPDRRSQSGQSFSPLFVGDFHALPRFGWLQFE